MRDLTKFTVAELLDQFRNSCLAQHHTYTNGDTRKYNRLNDFLLTITRELKRRGGDERRILMMLFADGNLQVRLKAATHVYSVAPLEAKACLKAVAATRLPDVSLAAGMMLQGLEEDPNCLDWI